jgi:hypothetical protein
MFSFKAPGEAGRPVPKASAALSQQPDNGKVIGITWTSLGFAFLYNFFGICPHNINIAFAALTRKPPRA